MTPPLFILSLPRSFSTVAGMMLGNHPQTFGVPELNLFMVETMNQWLRFGERAPFRMHDGLLRTISELYFASQTDDGILRAREWIIERGELTTAAVFRQIAARVSPRILVEKSPTSVLWSRALSRISREFPDARFLHLTRHPRGYCDSMFRMLKRYGDQEPRARWIFDLATKPAPGSGGLATGEQNKVLDPQHGWLRFHSEILQFLESVPAERQRRVRGESLLSEPDRVLGEIAAWLGIDGTRESLEMMKHPEQSPFARPAPANAWAGSDPLFLESPALRAPPDNGTGLSGPLAWRSDGSGFSPGTCDLARHFGYR